MLTPPPSQPLGLTDFREDLKSSNPILWGSAVRAVVAGLMLYLSVFIIGTYTAIVQSSVSHLTIQFRYWGYFYSSLRSPCFVNSKSLN